VISPFIFSVETGQQLVPLLYLRAYAI